MDVRLNGEHVEIKVDCLKYLGSSVTVDRGVDTEVKCWVKEAGKVLWGLKKVFELRILVWV